LLCAKIPSAILVSSARKGEKQW
jgi:PHP family Zn ribbon phosphoesterase